MLASPCRVITPPYVSAPQFQKRCSMVKAVYREARSIHGQSVSTGKKLIFDEISGSPSIPNLRVVVVGGIVTEGMDSKECCFQLGLAIHQNHHQARRKFVEWAQNEIAVVPDFHKRILFSDEEHFWLNGYVNKQNCRNWSEANPQVYVETPLHPEKLTVWCALWAGGILLQKR
ncbi:hypothetical protein TNCV_4162031 [Trichonephila clavipes]|nr:hypothetical protein TNCV_4162031 [Trichonephila clavipes]